MKRLSSELGPLGQVLADLPENPLPLSIEVEVPAERRDPAVLRAASIELRRLPGFVQAFEPDGLAIDEFDGWGPTRRTLRAFIGSYHDLLHLVTEAQLG